MHNCIRLTQTTRRVYNRNVTPLNLQYRHPAVRLQARFSTSTSSSATSSSPNTTASRPPKPPPKRRAKKALLFTTIALLSAATWHQYNSTSNPPLDILDEHRFQPFTITSKTRVSSTATIFTLRPAHPPSASSPDPYASLWPHTIWSLSFKQPQLQIARSYTPLPPLANTPPDALRFLIRREYKGEVSGYLDQLPVGAAIEVRGPRVECRVGWDVSEVVFLAGGTGIAAAMQAVRAVLGEGGEERRVRILWANRRREECEGAPVQRGRGALWRRLWRGGLKEVEEERGVTNANALVEEIRGLQRRYGEGRVEVRYFVDAEGTFIDRDGILDAVRSAKDGGGRKMIMVSGPEGFVKHYAGARVWEGGEEKQGPVGGVIKGLGLKGWEVVKL